MAVVLATKEDKAKRFPKLYCEDCLQDPKINCPRDKDVKCLHCGKELCGYHMIKHLKEVECVSTEWTGMVQIPELPYCVCCGRENSNIQKELDKLTFVDGKRTWEGHTQHEGRSFFYDRNTVEFCEKCGTKLDENEDVLTTREFMGYFGSARACQTLIAGYHCGNCGF